MAINIEGFWQPEIDIEHCSGCGACTSACPSAHVNERPRSSPSEVYACWNKDEDVRFRSASGGAFSAFARRFLRDGGVVFGAAFDEAMQVNHIAVHSEAGLARLRSSKYVQSNIGRSCLDVRDLLREGRKVLFSGTPCQIAALHMFVDRDDENLLTCDVLCHGVSSPGLFVKYVEYLEKRFQAELIHINFRHKRQGWKLVSTVASFANGQVHVLNDLNNSFMYGFSNNLILRPACYRCPYASPRRTGDISLGDFWGIGQTVEFHGDTRNGISLVLVNSEKGRSFFRRAADQLYVQERTLEEALSLCTALSRPWPEPEGRARLFADLQRLEFHEVARQHLVDRGLKRLIKRVVPRSWILSIKEHLRKMRD